MTTAIGIKLKKPNKTRDHSSREEVMSSFNMDDHDRQIVYSKIIEEVYQATNGDIPAGIRLFAEKIKDPADLGAMMYLIGQQIAEDRILHEIPDVIKEAMKAGAQIAMHQMSADPEAPENLEIPAPDDPVYYG